MHLQGVWLQFWLNRWLWRLQGLKQVGSFQLLAILGQRVHGTEPRPKTHSGIRVSLP